jgi:hypothetical protein
MIINFEKIAKELNKQGIQNFLGSPEKVIGNVKSNAMFFRFVTRF